MSFCEAQANNARAPNGQPTERHKRNGRASRCIQVTMHQPDCHTVPAQPSAALSQALSEVEPGVCGFRH